MVTKLENLRNDRKLILDLIQKQGPLSKQDIQNKTNIKLTTLNRIITDLLSMYLINEALIGQSTGGRKPILYDVNLSNFFIVGVDISRTYIQIVITNLKMKIISETRFIIDRTFSYEKTIEMIIQSVSKLISELKIPLEQVLGIGVGTVGPLDRKKGMLLNPRYFKSNDWQEKSIKNDLASKFLLPVIIDNGANSAVLGEYYYGIGKGYNNIAYFNCGIGIRTGVITDGKIIRTINDREDSFGHMVINIDGKQCYCGNFGCVESYASISSILNDYIEEIKVDKENFDEKSLDDVNFIDMFLSAEKESGVAKKIVTNSAIVFGTALANYINLLNPQLVILSGPTIHNSNVFYTVSSETALKKINTNNICVNFSKGGAFNEKAIAVGAAAMVFESFINNDI